MSITYGGDRAAAAPTGASPRPTIRTTAVQQLTAARPRPTWPRWSPIRPIWSPARPRTAWPTVRHWRGRGTLSVGQPRQDPFRQRIQHQRAQRQQRRCLVRLRRWWRLRGWAVNAISRLRRGDRSPAFMRSPPTIAFARDEASRAVLTEVLEPGAATVSKGGIEEATGYMLHDPSSQDGDRRSVRHGRAAGCAGSPGRDLPAQHAGHRHRRRQRHPFLPRATHRRGRRISGEADHRRGAARRADRAGGARPRLPHRRFRPSTARPLRSSARGAASVRRWSPSSLAWLSTERPAARRCWSTSISAAAPPAWRWTSNPATASARRWPIPTGSTPCCWRSPPRGSASICICCRRSRSLDGSQTIQSDAIEKLSKGLRQGFKRVIFDVPRSDGAILKQVLGQAERHRHRHRFLHRRRPRYRPAVRARPEAGAGGEAGWWSATDFGTGRKGDLTRAEIEKALGLTMACVIPEDPGRRSAGDQFRQAGAGVRSLQPGHGGAARARRRWSTASRKQRPARAVVTSFLATGARKARWPRKVSP
jgi:hypothetical protein